ncbi:acyl-ACP--UDP-N-acetylglucosamine O-acyltransferase [Candidatus Magnetomonas plexicatena]|uniref:acyl-ACP--UDP-N-acetylglucosamine O-acyltransferase n=1 Tax=Candidatus Magnetomonas plexicatena TaxID=2552947 RepID=UPI001C7931F0|nr:acyl-ACP--UDP-N-acetylglucosamine O-acyltransferase [Nitrospirales bacterium LBB_01]
MKPDIHPTAIVGQSAKLSDDTSVGPYCIIGDNVTIGKGTKLMSNIVLDGTVEIGEDCQIYPFTSIGLPPQDLKYDGRATKIRIGNKNIIREYTTIHRASVGGDGITEIGNNNFIMAYVHIAHDCKLGNSIVMANAATLAGHVSVGDHAVFGGIVAVHQFTRIGAYAMVGGFSGIGQDIPPFMMASGPRARLYGPNVIGLKRHGFTDDRIQNLKRAYKVLFRDKLTLKEALDKVISELGHIDDIKKLTEFISQNTRGICR